MVKKLDWDTKLKFFEKENKATCDINILNLKRTDKIQFTCNCGNLHTAMLEEYVLQLVHLRELVA